MRVVQGQDDRQVDEMRERHSCDVVEMQDVDMLRGIGDGPAGVIEILQLGPNRIADGPVGVFVAPFDSAG